jgi:putative intracellular protease/amidase
MDMAPIRRADTSKPVVAHVPKKAAEPAKPSAAAPAAAGWQPKGNAAAARSAAAPAAPEIKGNARISISAAKVDQVRQSGDPAQQAKVLNSLATGRPNLLLHNDATRVDRTKQLFAGMTPKQVDAVRASYIKQFGCDPEIHIRSDDLGQPIHRLDRAVELEMVGALNGPQMKADAATLAGMLEKAKSGTLTTDDRQKYFSMLPRMGLWDAPTRATPGDAKLDSLERTQLGNAFGAQGTGVELDAALKKIEGAMPPANLAPTGPREKSIAVVISSHGAQWQELMDWAQPMVDKGYQLQLFTPDGRPVAFQRDSLSVSNRTVNLGFGAPGHLDPAGPTGEVARKLLGNTAGAAKFDPKQFGAVYLAGGLGFNEDVAIAKGETRPDGTKHSVLTANPNIEKMMNAAVGERLPVIALCHGPTLLAAIDIEVGGKKEKLNKGIETASLPPFEGYVGFTGRKEIQFTYDVNTHAALRETGGETHVLKDIANMNRVVKAHKDGMDIITGPGPQTARELVDATVESITRRWD